VEITDFLGLVPDLSKLLVDNVVSGIPNGVLDQQVLYLDKENFEKFERAKHYVKVMKSAPMVDTQTSFAYQPENQDSPTQEEFYMVYM